MRPPQREYVRRGRSEGHASSPCGGRAAASTDTGTPERERLAQLECENAQLREAMESRPVIDMARGVLMAGFGCPPDDAFEILAMVSQHSNIKLRLLAKTVTAAATGREPMPPKLQDHLAAAVDAWRRARETGMHG
ncbi:ANTAR domain-containing protein [Streptomyces sp. NPDC007205]|uniref:ANTAR domain-containing protein n=1 Tax=Streptomyces sp. NPDC007205 TaxID=3154316 RepID=UPI0033F25905